MKHKENMFSYCYYYYPTDDYKSWKLYLEGSSSSAWLRLNERFAEDYQFALLRGMTITGTKTYSWNDIFDDVYKEKKPFEGLCKMHFQGQLKPDWRFFAKKFAFETTRCTYYPAHFPEWLLMFGYNQRQYLQDLAVYWDDISDEYYKPWPGNRLGVDSPEVARLKRLGEVARAEITEIAQHGSQQGKR